MPEGESGPVLLELGVGDNPWFEHISRRYLGDVDPKQAKIVLADKRLEGLRWLRLGEGEKNKRLVQFDGAKIPLETDSVRLLFSVGLWGGEGGLYARRGETLGLTDEVVRVEPGIARDSFRVIEPGGVCLVVEPAPGLGARLVGELKQLYMQAGFRLKEELSGEDVGRVFAVEKVAFSRDAFALVLEKPKVV